MITVTTELWSFWCTQSCSNVVGAGWLGYFNLAGKHKTWLKQPYKSTAILTLYLAIITYKFDGGSTTFYLSCFYHQGCVSGVAVWSHLWWKLGCESGWIFVGNGNLDIIVQYWLRLFFHFEGIFRCLYSFLRFEWWVFPCCLTLWIEDLFQLYLMALR